MNEVKRSRPTDLGMADEPAEHLPFLGSGEHSASNAELNKKWKLQYEEDNLGLPWPKQQYRDRSSSSMHKSPIFNSKENNGTRGKEIASGEILNTLAQSEESDNNSNNSSRADNNLMTLDVQAKEEKSIFLHNLQTTTSSITSSYTVSASQTGSQKPTIDQEFEQYFSMHMLYGELSTSNAELNKKRTLQYEVDNLGLPWPKQKYRDRSSSSMHESLIFNSKENNGTRGKEIASGEIHNTLAQSEESDNNSNNSSRADNNLMMLDVQVKEENSIFLRNLQTATSSNPSGYSVSGKVNEEGTADLKETIKSEPRENATGDGVGASHIDDLQIAQYDINCDAVQDDTMLCTNDVAPNAFLFSSERWRLGQDQNVSRKSTIDQEFEQYFSMPNAVSFSSERQRLGQDSQTGSRKPIIDQDFEQYFSMPNAVLFSSERRSLGQDSQTASRKLTIDQEFEQYFSMPNAVLLSSERQRLGQDSQTVDQEFEQ